ncbi:MAG: hypothetical protein GY700_07290, partial [Propionibacteriaceae bacterium]|nr:hypothetical protein [Propionibacteriaceae bacterium]
MTPAGVYYFELLRQTPPNRRYDPAQRAVRRGQSDYITLRDNSQVAVRRWSPKNGRWDMTRLGKEFYSDQRANWIVRIPVKTHLKRKNGTYYVKDGWIDSTSIPALGELSFPATMSEAQQRAEVRRRTQAYLDTKTEWLGMKMITDGGDYDPQVYDESRGLEFSREEIRVADGEAQVTAAIDRPLRDARPIVYGDMANVHGLAPEGFEVPAGVNCVVHQLQVLVRCRGRPLWTRECLEHQFDGLQSELYGDGEPYWDEESGSTLDWRSVGVTAHMVLALCKRHNIPVNILW